MSAPVLSVDETAVLEEGIKLNWSNASGTILTQYLLFTTKEQDSPFYSRVSLENNKTSHNLLNLANGVEYLVSLVQELSGGIVKTSNTVMIRGLNRPPAPTILDVIGLDEKMKIIMRYEDTNIVPPITSITFVVSDGTTIFTIEKSVTDYVPTEFILQASDSPLIQNYRSYEIASFVRNERGESPLSNAVKGMPCDYPNQPTGLTSTPSDKTVLLNWNHPSDFSEYKDTSSVLKYVVSYKKTTASAWLTVEKNLKVYPEPSLSISSLDNVSHDFKIHYVNDCGTGVVSATIQSHPFAPSTEPLSVRAEPSNHQVKLLWDAPSNSGGYSVSSYDVKIGSVWTNVGLATNFTFTGLTNGISQLLKVRAITRNTELQQDITGSESSISSTPFTNPSAPTNLTIQNMRDRYLEIKWDAPLDNGYPIHHYMFQELGGYLDIGNQTVYTFQDHSNGVNYNFNVKAVSYNTELQTYFESSVATISGISYTNPPSPVLVSKTPMDKSVAVVWDVPSQNTSGFAIDGFRVKNGSSFTDLPVSTKQYTFTGLTNGVLSDNLQVLSISTHSITGEKLYSAPLVIAEAPFTKPDKVNTPSGVPGDKQIQFYWYTPNSDGGRPLQDFKIVVDNVGEFYTTLTNYLVSGLTNGVAYTAHIFARNTGGLFSDEMVVQSIPFKVSEAPLNFSAVFTHVSSMTLQWDAPTDTGGFPITGYVITYYLASASPVSPVSLSVAANMRNSVISNLMNGETYKAKIRAITEKGDGQNTPEVSFIPCGNPIITQVSVVQNKSLSVRVQPNGRKLVKYSALAIDSDPTTQEELFQQSSISVDTYTGELTMSIPFNTFSTPISKYLVVIYNEVGATVSQNFSV